MLSLVIRFDLLDLLSLGGFQGIVLLAPLCVDFCFIGAGGQTLWDKPNISLPVHTSCNSEIK